MTYQEACKKAMDYFDREFRKEQAERIKAMRESNDPWTRGQYDLWGKHYDFEKRAGQ